MDLGFLLRALIPSWNSIAVLLIFFAYLAVAGSILPGKLVPGVTLQDGSRLHYHRNGLLALLLLVGLLGVGSKMNFLSPMAISDRGLELLSATFIFSFFVMLVLYAAGSRSYSKGSSLTGNLIHDWWYGIRLNPHFIGIDLNVQDGSLSQSMILYQLFCVLYVLDYFVHEEYMTSTWDIIAERLGFMLVFGDLLWIPFTFSIQYLVFTGANKQKHIFKKNPKVLIWGKPPKVIGGKLLASGYWGIARHYNYLEDLLLAFSFSLPCGISSPIPYFYQIYLFILLVRRDEAHCAENYKEIWAEYCRLLPHRIFPYLC